MKNESSSFNKKLLTILKNIHKNLSFKRWVVSSKEEHAYQIIKKLSLIEAKDLMEERVDIKLAIDIEDINIEKLLNILSNIPTAESPKEKSRSNSKETTQTILVYSKNLDQIIGIINCSIILKAVLSNLHNVPKDGVAPSIDLVSLIKSELVPPLFVPPSMHLVTILEQMFEAKTDTAVVSDEYGGTDGVIYLEDIVRYIIGYANNNAIDHIQSKFSMISKNVFEINGRMNLGDFEALMEVHIVGIDDHNQTVGGWILGKFGYVPNIGETLKFHNNFIVEIKERSSRTIKKVIVYKISTS